MNHSVFSYPLAFPLAPPAGQMFHLYSKISLCQLDGLARNLIDIHDTQKTNPVDVGDSLIFLLVKH